MTENQKRQGRIDFVICELRSLGYTVEPADIPGLYWVNGRELTIAQMFDVANRGDPGRLAMALPNWM